MGLWLSLLDYEHRGTPASRPAQRLTALSRTLGLVCLVTLTGACAPRIPELAPRAAPTALPDVLVEDLEHRPVRLAELTQGRPALINLWATWCEACKDELQALNRLHDALRQRGLIVGVAVGESHANVLAFLKRHPLNYTLLVDGELRFADALQSDRVPTTLVVDGAGSIRFRAGELDKRAIEALNELLP